MRGLSPDISSMRCAVFRSWLKPTGTPRRLTTLSPLSSPHWTDSMTPSGKSVPILDQSVHISALDQLSVFSGKGSNMSSHAESDLFQPVKLGAYTLANRIVMAPL